MRAIYRAGRQLAKVRAMMLFSVACAAGFFYWGHDLLLTLGLRPADGGVLKPLGERAAWAAFLWGFGFAFAAGMWVYGRCYVAEIQLDEPNRRLVLRTLNFLWPVEEYLPFGTRTHASYNHGSFRAGGMSVRAPWTTVRVPGRRLPLVLDQQGEFTDRPEVEKRLFGRPS